RRVRAGDDRGSRQVRAAPGQAARDQEREADRPPARARAYAGSNPGSLSGRWHRNARPGKALSGQPWHGADTAQPRSLTTQTAPSKSELSVKIKKISETATGEKIFLGIDSGHSGSHRGIDRCIDGKVSTRRTGSAAANIDDTTLGRLEHWSKQPTHAHSRKTSAHNHLSKPDQAGR